jgi:hypothetical protein
MAIGTEVTDLNTPQTLFVLRYNCIKCVCDADDVLQSVTSIRDFMIIMSVTIIISFN